MAQVTTPLDVFLSINTVTKRGFSDSAYHHGLIYHQSIIIVTISNYVQPDGEEHEARVMMDQNFQHEI
ncbi:hypothetical protein SeMB42_g02088 [Synchytrium endobioticum]|uniref:Uncharacterized protein n=1 Tax=Synchytrium endobioticum TaxID=286115 RepID=A0A507DH23_9FUNG|nr:hypothetical protein SeMB42_g02088 [Synchytrium endobioticum]